MYSEIATTLSGRYAPTTKNLKSDRNRKPISGAKVRFTKSHNLMITSVFERK